MHSLNMMAHFRMMSDAAQSIGARAQLDFDSLRVEVAASGRYFELEPEFLGFRDGRGFLSQTLDRHSVAFTGWQHGQRVRWRPDKRLFKEFCARNELRTPRSYTRGGDVASVLVKEVMPAGAHGVIHGPFDAHSVPTAGFKPDAGWFLEEFISGDTVMALYHEGELFSAEARKKPRITGDGSSSVRELIESSCQEVFAIDWGVAQNLLRLQGVSLDSVPASGKEIVVDVRFWSGLQTFTTTDQNMLSRIGGTPLHQQLLHAGPILWRAIPEEVRTHKQFEAYAVVDAQQRVWFIDIGTDGRIDPHGYRPMLRKLFSVSLPKVA